MNVSFSWLHWGLLFGYLQFPDQRVRVLLVGPVEIGWPDSSTPGKPARRLFWLWSLSRVFQFLIGDSPGTTAFGLSLSLEHEGQFGPSLRIQFPRISVLLNWLPAHLPVDRKTMREWSRYEQAQKQITTLMEKLFGQNGSNLEAMLRDLEGPKVDLRGKSNLN
jgi:hypothetical protein